MKTFALLLTISLSITSFSQDDMSPFAVTGFGGVNFFKPDLSKKGMQYQGDPIGIYMNVNGMFFTHNKGQVRKLNAPIEEANINFSLTTLGYQVGKDFKIGTESYLSASVKPYVCIGAVVGSFPTARIFEDVSSFGLFISPGIDFRLSQLNIGVQYQTMGLIHGAFGYDKSYNFGRGLLHGLAFNIGISNSFDLLTPKAYTFKGLDVDVEVTEKEWIEYDYRYGDWYRMRVTETTTTTTKTPGKRTLTLVTPFFGIGPSFKMNYTHDRSAASQIKGINGGFRFSYLMVDGFYEFGQYGLKDPGSWADIASTYPMESNFDFSYAVPVTNYGAKVGFNIAKFLTLNQGFEVHSDAGTAFWYVPFTRVHIFGTIGNTAFENAPTYTYANASSRIDDYYLNRNPDQNFHPDQLPESANFLGYGVNIEVGAVFLEWNKINYKNLPALTNSTYTVGANIPIGRIGTSLLAKRKYRKAWKSYKKSKK